ncbi:MAG: hypothetical protein GY809_06520 [Planctomycetes bacterium]|nr:hypothetical protein [Planctomycetota bacterium]
MACGFLIVPTQPEHHSSPCLPNTVTLWRPSSPQTPATETLVPMVESMVQVEGRATAYVCQDFACKQSVTFAEEFTLLIRGITRPAKIGHKPCF